MTAVGVLLPARIETRFDEGGPGGSPRLRIIVVPADIWFDRHDPRVGRHELDLLRTAAASCGGALLQDAGADAFGRLADQVGAGRAGWLAGFVSLEADGSWRTDVPPDRLRPEGAAPAPDVVHGLPATVELWATCREPDREVHLARLSPRNHLRAEPPAPGGDPVLWPRWDELSRAGLTATVNLAEIDQAGGPIDPASIAVLTAVGLGDTDPSALLGDHGRSGAAMLVPSGTPTNATPDVGYRRPSNEEWRRSATAPPPAADRLGAALGAPLPVPAPVPDPNDLQATLVAALWPALWGHAIEDIWGWPPGADASRIRSARWWEQHVRPDGPFPALLVRDQPYGVLPATHLAALDGEDSASGWTARVAGAYLPDAAARAERGIGTVVDAETDQVAHVLRQTPVSTGYAYRWAVPAQPTTALGRARLRRLREVLDQVAVDAERLHDPQVAVGGSAPVRIPLVEEDAVDVPPWFGTLHDELEQGLAAGWLSDEDLHRLEGSGPKRPGNRHRLFLMWLWAVCRRDTAGPASLTGVLSMVHELRPSLLVRLAAQALRVALDWPPDDGAADEVFGRTLEAVYELAVRPDEPPGTLDRVLRTVLDAATHRLDVLPVAVATARLSEAHELPRQLGLYGWVERPYRGTPGFSPGRVVLAPSPSQAKTAAILRDRFVVHEESGLTPTDGWDLTLDSASVRGCAELIEAVSQGAHPTEAIGRRVEACFRRHDHVEALRRRFPADADAHVRRICDGFAAMALWTTGDPSPFAAATGIPTSAFTRSVTRELDALAATPAVLADLHLAEAVHATVLGGAAATGRALDAVAGLGEPIELRAMRTPVPGTPLTTRVHLCLAEVPEPGIAGADGERAVHADPVATALLDGLGDPSDPDRFGWAAQGGPLTLADLGLAAGDLAAVDDATLMAAAVDAGATGPVPPGIADVRAVVAVLHRCAPVPAPPRDTGVLLERYRRLYAAAVSLRDDLLDAGAGGADPALRRRGLRWGLAGPAADSAALLTANLGRCPDPAALAADDSGQPERLVLALRGLASVGSPGGIRDVVPVLAVPAREPQTQPIADSSEWWHTFGPVRTALGEVGKTVLDARLTASHADGWGPGWTGRAIQRPDGTTRPGDARLLEVYLTVDGADPATAAMTTLDEWQETLPGLWSADGTVTQKVSATMGFGFNAPGARPPQAVVLAVPPTDDAPLDTDLVRAILAETRLLARSRAVRGRDLGRLGAFLPSAWLRADSDGIQLDDDSWTPPTPSDWLHARLEQAAPEGDVDEGLRARVADPLWMLSRQWQMGEHQGENASSPACARALSRTAPLLAPQDRPFADPTVLPGSAVVEAAGADVRPADGTADPFDQTTYLHATVLRAGGAALTVDRHPGGPTDWWVLDARRGFRAEAPTSIVAGLPGRMRYPGAPAPGWFTMEDPDESIMAHMPDSAHVGSLFLLDVIAGHATDWYLLPLPTEPGNVLSVRGLAVIDSFGDSWSLPAQSWPDPDRWSMYGTRGLRSRDLLLWPADPPPLEGPVLERVVIGVDEDANLLWAVETVVDGVEQPQPEHATVPTGMANDRPEVSFRAVAESPLRWHPYPATTGAPRRLYRQGRLATSADPGVTPLPSDTSRFLSTAGPSIHDIDPATVPAAGLTLERRWVLARAADGRPVLWQQRRRSVPQAPPAMRLPFDRVDPV